MRRNFDTTPPRTREATESDLLQLLRITGSAGPAHFNYYPAANHLRFSGIFPDAASAKLARQALQKTLSVKMPKFTDLEAINVVAVSLYGVTPQLIKRMRSRVEIKIIPD